MFTAEPLPQSNDLEALRAYLDRQMLAIQNAINTTAIIQFDQQFTAPEKVREVDYGYFDAGVVGDLAGFYFYVGGAWVLVTAGGPYRKENAAYLFSSTPVQQVFTASPTWDVISAIDSKGVELISTSDPTTKRITVHETRLYMVGGSASFQSDKNNIAFTLGFMRNGADPVTANSIYGTARQTGDQLNLRGTAPIMLNAGDTIEVRLQNNDAQAHTVTIRNATVWVCGQ